MIVGFNHVSLQVSDLERSIAFYAKHFSFQRGPAFVDDGGAMTGIYLYLSRRMFLELFPATAPVTPFSHFCLEVTGLNDHLASLRADGFKTTEVFLGRSKAWIASVWDPDGHHIELNEYSHPDSWMAHYLSNVPG